MSALNFLQPTDEQAVVVVDTLDNHGRDGSKLLPLPHLGAILASRGRRDVGMAIYQQLLWSCATFDEALEKVGGVYDAVLEGVPAHDAAVAQSLGLSVEDLHEQRLGNIAPELRAGQTCILVGWSDRAREVVGMSLQKDNGEAQVLELRSLHRYVGPPHPDLVSRVDKALLTDSGALQFMRDQHAMCVADKPGYGGRAILGRVTKSQVTIRDLGPI